MELPRNTRGTELLPQGAMLDIRQRVRAMSAGHDLRTVIACAFDHRTRILPFIYADKRMAPAGVRAVGSALVDVGFPQTRIVLQQWNRRFQPSQMKLDGRLPDIFMVSSMHVHGAACDQMLRDVCRIEPAKRPLVIVGGPRVIYEPWQVFSQARQDATEHWGADLAVTGEEYVLLSLLEILLSERGRGESLRSTFQRARDSGALDALPGLFYSRSATPEGPPEELLDTGIQRLLGDLDELPHPVLGYQLLEPPSSRTTLGPHALPANRVRKHASVSSLVLTFGCKFRCNYCPIPAYNQRQHRTKSGERVADEMQQIAKTYGIYTFFGADDNFFNDRQRTLEIVETLARKATQGRPFCKMRFGTEATVHDTLRLREHLPAVRRAGLVALWLGVEDITASLVRKGQNENNTIECFRLLRENGIVPVPMMMHSDEQPLISRNSNHGLLNQLRLLRRSGAMMTQVLMLTPAPGSKLYVPTYTSKMAFQEVNGVPVGPEILDGNYVVASHHRRPWVKQLNLLAGYTYFYNPLRLLLALAWSKSRIPHMDSDTRPENETRKYSWLKKRLRRLQLRTRAHLIDSGLQIFGMCGLFHTYRRTLSWAWHLLRGNIKRYEEAPTSRIPMRSALDPRQQGSHALPNTPTPNTPLSDAAAAGATLVQIQPQTPAKARAA